MSMSTSQVDVETKEINDLNRGGTVTAEKCWDGGISCIRQGLRITQLPKGG